VARGGGGEPAWSVALGLLAPAVVAIGPRAVGLADRVAVPAMLLVGVLLLARCLSLPGTVLAAPGAGGLSLARGFDVVVGYQVSWILMFSDYSRYTASPRGGAIAVFLGLALTSLWFMPLGMLGALIAGDADPGRMMMAMGLGTPGALLLALGTVTTNFVNIYLSALALRSLVPRVPAGLSVWAIGAVGTALGLLSRVWLDRYADFMLLLGGLLVPAGGVLFWRFFLSREPVAVPALYAADGPYARARMGAIAAWAAGGIAFHAAARVGGTLPGLVVAMIAAAVFSGRRATAASRSR
jgi:purine-cytosine permease-like protein